MKTKKQNVIQTLRNLGGENNSTTTTNNYNNKNNDKKHHLKIYIEHILELKAIE